MKGQKILVVGATGLIGCPLAKKLAKENQVYGLARFSKKGLKEELDKHGITSIEMDVAGGDFRVLPSDFDYVFNELLYLNTQDLEKSLQVNTFPVIMLLERFKSCKGMILGSTGSVYGKSEERKSEDAPLNASNAYEISKYCADMFATYYSRQYDIPTVILRYYTPYSTSRGLVRNVIGRIMADKPVQAGEKLYCPMFISDVVELTIKAAGVCTSPANIVNIGGEELVSMKELAAMTGKVINREPSFVPCSEKRSDSEICDSTKRKRILGSEKVPLHEGIKKTWEAYR